MGLSNRPGVAKPKHSGRPAGRRLAGRPAGIRLSNPPGVAKPKHSGRPVCCAPPVRNTPHTWLRAPTRKCVQNVGTFGTHRPECVNILDAIARTRRVRANASRMLGDCGRIARRRCVRANASTMLGDCGRIARESSYAQELLCVARVVRSPGPQHHFMKGRCSALGSRHYCIVFARLVRAIASTIS